ncbi:MAG: PAS-domain containing protein [Roseovarius sp.]|uniref:PAS-domain containing protein n=1 Tax=Roseovarius sp. TaxID=1486281 RepID=UPI0032EECAB7
MQGILLGMPVAVVLSGLMAGLVIWALARWPLWLRRRPGARSRAGRGATNFFLFRDGLLIDHDTGPPDRPGDPLTGVTEWPDLRAWLDPRFPGLPADLPPMSRGQVTTHKAQDPADPAVITIAAIRQGHRITLIDPALPSPADWHDALTRLAAKRLLRRAAETAPIAICTLDRDGNIAWRNAVFQEFSDAEESRLLHAASHPADTGTAPVTLTDPDTGRARHIALTLTGTGDQRILYAADVTDLVNTDAMRSSFIQTLTKTFADLATGLAVFDRGQRLALFNPALVDLTDLPIEFLSARPGLLDFFDRLRDRQVLPEPKNYASWRAQINEMIETAAGGLYSEAWSLTCGLTYRVTGRPHPDGAIAFLFEDITDEISLTRRTRSQLEIRQAVLDRLDDAIAVLGPDGTLILCNQPFRDRFAVADDTFTETTLAELVQKGRTLYPNDTLWADLLAGPGHPPLTGPAGNATTGHVRLRTSPLTGGFTMLSLSPMHEAGLPAL